MQHWIHASLPTLTTRLRLDSRGAHPIMAGMKSCTLPGRLGRGLLVVLALLLPFEAPLFRVGPLQLTTVELVLYATLAAWGLTVALQALPARRDPAWPARAVAALRGDRMMQAAILWAVVPFVSALAAPLYQGASLKFSLRSLSGVLAFFAARTLARPPEVGRRVLRAVMAGGVVSAATAVIDSMVPSSGAAWTFFREGNFNTLGLARASGVFAYPTIGAMYWEATLPLLIVAPFLGREARTARGSAARAALVWLASALLVSAILASATRSALVGAVVACAAMLALAWRAGAPLRRVAVGVLAVLVASSGLALAAPDATSLLGQRLRFWHDDRWLRVEYGVDPARRTASQGETLAIPVSLRNTGTVTWHRAGAQPVFLAYHWERIGGRSTLADFEGWRTELPADLPPGGTLEVVAKARAPAIEGAYRLRWDLVQEGVTWFSDVGNPAAEQPFDVTPSTGTKPDVAAKYKGRPAAPTPAPSRPALWRAAVALWRAHPLLGVGPDNFRRRYEAVLSAAPNGQPYTDTRIHANNLYFETLADLGLAGVAALAWMAFALARTLRSHHATGNLPGLASGVAAGAFFVHGALDYFFEFTPLFGLFWVLLGLTAACAPAEPSPGAPPDSPP
jgi:O-Antigen ligase